MQMGRPELSSQLRPYRTEWDNRNAGPGEVGDRGCSMGNLETARRLIRDIIQYNIDQLTQYLWWNCLTIYHRCYIDLDWLMLWYNCYSIPELWLAGMTYDLHWHIHFCNGNFLLQPSANLQVHTHNHILSLEIPPSLQSMSLVCGRKPEYLQETHQA